ILIAGTLTFRIFVFMREKPPKMMEEMFRAMILDLENRILLEDIIDDKIIGPAARQIIGTHFPLALMGTFTVDAQKLKIVENESRKMKIPQLSSRALLALKQLALVRAGVVKSLKESPEKQGQQFDSLAKKGRLPTVGVLHFDIATNLLDKTLKVPEEFIHEALWVGSQPEIKIIIPREPVSQEGKE
ncbi:MAG TPA: hypothetical protein VJ044_16060, partial [Candidatus Hodarchaeales archaeon]|nr:hypothetical protein [Candidatus Hodarchaeales archaeon]